MTVNRGVMRWGLAAFAGMLAGIAIGFMLGKQHFTREHALATGEPNSPAEPARSVPRNDASTSSASAEKLTAVVDDLLATLDPYMEPRSPYHEGEQPNGKGGGSVRVELRRPREDERVLRILFGDQFGSEHVEIHVRQEDSGGRRFSASASAVQESDAGNGPDRWTAVSGRICFAKNPTVLRGDGNLARIDLYGRDSTGRLKCLHQDIEFDQH